MTQRFKKPDAARRRTAFTLVELLIVVTILGILATVVLPQFSNASSKARHEAMRSQLKTLRTQIKLYKLHHGGELPDLISDWSALTNSSTYQGKKVGPYLSKGPINGFNDLSNVEDGDGSVPLGHCGFIYDFAGGGGTGNILATDESASIVYDEALPVD